MPLSLNAAAKHAHVAKSTLHEALKNGDVKAEKNAQGQWDIDTSSLAQWISNRSKKPRQADLKNQFEQLFEPSSEQTEATVLKARLEVMEKRFSDAERTIEDLRRRLDTEGEERRKLTALLTDERGKPKGFWTRLFG